MDACVYGCVYASMILLDALRRCYWGFSVCAFVFICMRMCVCACVRIWVHVCVCAYVCMYFCVYVCMCVCVRVHVDVRMHSCRRILFICTVQSLYYMRVYHRCFLTLACVCVGGWGVCLSLIMVSACFWRGRLCFGRGRDRGFVLDISLFLRVLGWGVCVCLYTRVHTHNLLGHLM